ncbi:TIGR04442 family protein [bacterium]|nr:MAG: TIGR04442 family protein [bacterium]
MIKDYRIHGVAGPNREFYATLTGQEIGSRYFHEMMENEGVIRHRFFSGGNEFIIGPEGLSHTGNGGSFCPYMFGVDEPIVDLVKADVINRLVLFGARHDDSPKITFDESTSGKETFKETFLRGHAVFNYYFFVHFTRNTPLKRQQEKILQILGKALKRLPLSLDDDDSRVSEELYSKWSDLGSAFLLLKVINRSHLEFYRKFDELYSMSRSLGEEEQKTLDQLAQHLEIDPYSQERIKIDVMFRNSENREVVA